MHKGKAILQEEFSKLKESDGNEFKGLIVSTDLVKIDGERQVLVFPRVCRENDTYNTPCFGKTDTGQNLKKWWDELPQFAKIRLAFRQQKARQLLEKSKIGERFRLRTFDSFEEHCAGAKGLKKLAVDYVGKWEKISEQGQGLYISGSVGIGKTHIVSGIAKSLIEKYGTQVIFMPVPSLLQQVRGSISTDGTTQLFELYSGVELLILDDIGTERMTEWGLEFLFLLVNERYENMKPTIFTSNYTIGDLENRLSLPTMDISGQRIADRITETCRVIELSSMKESYRGKIEKL